MSLGRLVGGLDTRDAARGVPMCATTDHIVRGTGEGFDPRVTSAGSGLQGRGAPLLDPLAGRRPS